MALEIPSSLVEFILLGPADDRRQLQDSPILGDVWIEFAKQPDKCLDLLITPYMLQPAGKVASEIFRRYRKLKIKRPRKDEGANIAYLQGIVAARLYFKELLRLVVPMTGWWEDKRKTDANGVTTGHELADYGSPEKTKPIIEFFIASATAWQSKTRLQRAKDAQPRELTSLDRYVVLTGLILWASDQGGRGQKPRQGSGEKIEQILKRVTAAAVTDKLLELLATILADTELIGRPDADETAARPAAKQKAEALVWQISLNRTANPALAKSVPAVKADAAKFLFKVDTGEIAWAVLDSGIDGRHPAFGKADKSGIRIKRGFDFMHFRRIVSLSNSSPAVRKRNREQILQHEGLKIRVAGDDEESRKQAEAVRKETDEALEELAEDAKRGSGAIHWHLVEKLVEIHPDFPPPSSHGTHVAGIIGASRDAACGNNDALKKKDDIRDGMCPEINFYDFRVIGPTMEDTEFAIIGALQYIRYLNDRDNFFTIHGANLSLSIPHDVRNFACGRTPICNECERLVDSGVVVVAAAGNHGYKSFETKEGAYESYAAFSITDPGNADGVITVGATHRNWPHTYGVSFFSSRGPTGDGRLKPDLVAPGERIRAPLPGGKPEDGGHWGDLDGTSMAAPHVSGAAAMLLARYSELIGQPRRVKRILCDTATDLGRERSFQGHGMLDVLRAFQNI